MSWFIRSLLSRAEGGAGVKLLETNASIPDTDGGASTGGQKAKAKSENFQTQGDGEILAVFAENTGKFNLKIWQRFDIVMSFRSCSMK